MNEWRKVPSYVLGNTGLELHPEYMTGWFFVVDSNGGKDVVLTSAAPLRIAKKTAERFAEKPSERKAARDRHVAIGTDRKRRVLCRIPAGGKLTVTAHFDKEGRRRICFDVLIDEPSKLVLVTQP